ncbi:YegP family protein, partial [Escherichia coli]
MCSCYPTLSKSSDNQFRFVLKAGNGETILTSE